jgi:hypothetical protein
MICATAVAAHGTGGSFNPTGSMAAGRTDAAAVLLGDGRILVAGGALSRMVEVYDPGNGIFVPTGTLNEVRFDSAAVPLDDGRVLLIGGWDGSAALATTELYEPGSARFTVAGRMATARVRAAATRLDDGRLLIAGGHDGNTAAASAELYDPESNTFTPTGSMTTARVGSATLLMNGTVLVVGGTASAGGVDGSIGLAELYDPVAGAFTSTGNLRIGRRGHQATRLADGRVLITGGLDETGASVTEAELYDPADGAFHPAGRMQTGRAGHRAVLLPSGAVLAIGGHDGGSATLTSAELYEPNSDSFSYVAGLAEARSNPAVVTLADGRLLVAGGTAPENRWLATAETYDAIQRRPTSTSVSANRSAAIYGQPIVYQARVSGLTGTGGGHVRFTDGGTLVLGTASVDGAGLAALTTGNTPAGLRSITAEYEGSSWSDASSSTALTQSVSRAPASSTLAVSPLSVAYSDVVKLEATISGAQGEPPARGVIFNVAMQQMNREPVPFENMGGGVWRATLSAPLLENSTPGQLKPTGGVKIVTASLVGLSRNYSVNDPVGKAFIIGKEDARVTYDGPRTVMTSSRGGSTATVPLRAILRDVAVTFENNGDKTAGDVRLAQVYFIDRATNALIGLAKISLGDQDDPSTGIATFDWNVNIGPTAASKTYTVGIIVSNYYQRNSTLDNALVTVARRR